ncbi:MAG: hypothetical protein V8T08_05125 [Monoglobus pectinilyticus]
MWKYLLKVIVSIIILFVIVSHKSSVTAPLARIAVTYLPISLTTV